MAKILVVSAATVVLLVMLTFLLRIRTRRQAIHRALCKVPLYRYLFVGLPGSTAPDAKWGLVQVALSVYFFAFAWFISALSAYLSVGGGTVIKGELFVKGLIVAIVVSGIGTLFMFAYTVFLGIKFMKTHRTYYDPDEMTKLRQELSDMRVLLEHIRQNPQRDEAKDAPR